MLSGLGCFRLFGGELLRLLLGRFFGRGLHGGSFGGLDPPAVGREAASGHGARHVAEIDGDGDVAPLRGHDAVVRFGVRRTGGFRTRRGAGEQRRAVVVEGAEGLPGDAGDDAGLQDVQPFVPFEARRVRGEVVRGAVEGEVVAEGEHPGEDLLVRDEGAEVMHVEEQLVVKRFSSTQHTQKQVFVLVEVFVLV